MHELPSRCSSRGTVGARPEANPPSPKHAVSYACTRSSPMRHEFQLAHSLRTDFDRIHRRQRLPVRPGPTCRLQIASLPQRGVPALLTEQLLDISRVIREHPRAGRDGSWMGAPHLSHLVTAVRSALLSVPVLHESCLQS